jgi:hypothetical protein
VLPFQLKTFELAGYNKVWLGAELNQADPGSTCEVSRAPHFYLMFAIAVALN